MKRATTLLLALALILSLSPMADLADTQDESANDSRAYGSEVWLRDTVLQEGVTYSENIFWSGTFNGPRHEHYFTYTPGGDVRPVVAYGETVCQRVTTSAAARSYEEQGYRVVGAINGDFFNTGNGCPLGIVISDGKLLSGPDHVAGIRQDGRPTYYAVGFRADGTVVMGEPQLAISATDDRTGWSIPLSSINRPQSETAYADLITYDYRTDHTTGPLYNGLTALCAIVEGEAVIGGALVAEVEEIVPGNNPLELREDQVALSIPYSGDEESLLFVQDLEPGSMVTFSFASPDPVWEEVSEAIGALYLLVEDGVPQSDFEAGNAPRTAVGLKENGDLVLYTIDGRQSGVSVGAYLSVLAMRMAELGCVTALCLDGGGSTTAVAALPGEETARVLNSPSDGTERKDPNHILLLSPGEPTGIPGDVYLSADAPAVLSGKTLALHAGVVDTNYFPLDGPVIFSASAGTVKDGVFTAPEEGGVVTITAYAAYAPYLSTQLDILVVDAPDDLSILREGRPMSSLILEKGDSIQLGLSAAYRHLPLEAGFDDFIWTVSHDWGTIDETGVLTAVSYRATGTLTVSRGEAFSVTIPVTVEAEHPFADITGHWAEEHMVDMYRLGVLAGSEGSDGKVYAYPGRSATRQEFAVLLARYMGLDIDSYAEYETPFADMDKVSGWAANAVRAMSALGIIEGTTSADGTKYFAPKSTLSRAQAVTMIGRMLDLLEIEQQETDLTGFEDAGSIPSYARKYFETLVSMEVLTGSDGKLNPKRAMTRAAICKVLDLLPRE